MMLSKLGIDVAKHDFEVALWREEKLRPKKFENSVVGFHALSAWLAQRGVHQVHAVMEATGTFGSL